jgi:hypothetical protein
VDVEVGVQASVESIIDSVIEGEEIWVEDIKEERDDDEIEEVKSRDKERFYSTSLLFPILRSENELTNKLEHDHVVVSDTEVARLSALSAQFTLHVISGIDSTDDIHHILDARKTESWDDSVTLITEADQNTGFHVDSTSDADQNSDFMDANGTVCGTDCTSRSLKESIVSLIEDSAMVVEQIINVDTLLEKAISVNDQCVHEVQISAEKKSIIQSGDRSEIEQDAPLSAASDETEYGDTYDSDYCTSDITMAIADDVLVNSLQNEDQSPVINETICAANETSSSMHGNVDDCEYRSTTVSMHYLSTDSSISTISIMLDGLTDDVLAFSEFEAIDVSIQEICDHLHRSESLEDVAHTGMLLNTDVNPASEEATDLTLSEKRCVQSICVKDTAVGESIIDAAYHFETEEREYGNFDIYDPLVADDAILFLSRASSKAADRVAWQASDGIASITMCANQDPVCYPTNDNLPANYIENSLKINTFAKRLDYLISVDKLNSPKKIQDDDQPINEGTVKIIEEESVPLTDKIQETNFMSENIIMEKNGDTDVTDGDYHPQSLSAHENSLIALCSDSSKIYYEGVAPTLGRNIASVEDLCTISSAENTIGYPDKLRVELSNNSQDAERGKRSNISFFKRLFGKKDTPVEEKKFITVCCAGVLSAGSCYSPFPEESLDGGLKRTSTVSGNSMLSTEDTDEGFLAA